ncbi:MAG TPA: RDD family protein, partial [Thermoleophilia bacterium]
GKRLLRLHVIGDDGSQARPLAVVVRNIIRIPEMYFLYLPSAVSCLASSKNKRLGDLAAMTVVVRRGAGPEVSGAARPSAPPLGRRHVEPGFATPVAASPSTIGPAAAAAPGASEALAGLKTAALAVRGAHLNYLRFSEVELAKGAAGTGGEPAGMPDSAAEHEYSPEYAAAWYTLADAVIAMQQAHAAAIAAATREGTSLPAICADQPDVTYLFRELEPYFTAGSDEQVHDAYMSVARGETTAWPFESAASRVRAGDTPDRG